MNRRQLFTIPNLLSYLRLLLVPVIVYVYWALDRPMLAAALLALSALTDVVDGFIARRFHMESDLGKALDPVADKLTQAAVVLLLMVRFPHMVWVFAALAAKELFIGTLTVLVLRRTGKVYSAKWYGKAATVLLNGTMVLHVVWPGVFGWLSDGTIAASAAMLVLALVLYAVRYLGFLRAAKG